MAKGALMTYQPSKIESEKRKLCKRENLQKSLRKKNTYIVQSHLLCYKSFDRLVDKIQYLSLVNIGRCEQQVHLGDSSDIHSEISKHYCQ